jgi:DNA polymerase-3 subunit alpha
MTDFAHLHVHSDYSLRDSIASIEELVTRAASLGMKHLALTDDDNLFGVLHFQRECEKQGIHPVIGCQFSMPPNSRLNLRERSGYYPLILLAAGGEGYRNLVKLSSYSNTARKIDDELLAGHHEGLIGLSGSPDGEIQSLILSGDSESAEKLAVWFQDTLGPQNFYLELQNHGIAGQKELNEALGALSRRTGIPLAATNNVCYIDREDAAAHDIKLCISYGKRREESDRLRFQSDEHYFKTGDEMAALFPDYPEAVSNTIAIAERCAAKIPLPGLQLPDFNVPQGFTNTAGYLTYLTLQGLKKRYRHGTAEARERAEYELGVIIKAGFSNIFLITADFVHWARKHDIPVGPGRAAVPGSIVAYALGITNIDPLKYHLLFEQFINPLHPETPRFAIDFADDRREEVIHYITEKYGTNRVGGIITFGRFWAKMVFQDVGRALNIDIGTMSIMTSTIPKDPRITLKKAFEEEPKFRKAMKNPEYRELFSLSQKLEGKIRHCSLWAGIVIGKTDLIDYVPLYRDRSGIIATQFSDDVLEDCGLAVFDLSGRTVLTKIRNIEKLFRRMVGRAISFSIDEVPLDYEDVFKLFGKGDTDGIFSFEFPFKSEERLQKILRRLKPEKIEDLIALTALYRPELMKHIDRFIDCKRGRRTVEYLHPCLEDILKETYGLIIYQEQIIEIIRRIAGYDPGQADLLFGVLDKNDRNTTGREKKLFIAGAVRQGFTEQDADRVFESLASFAPHSFSKSHAVADTLVSYQLAFLKAHFPW